MCNKTSRFYRKYSDKMPDELIEMLTEGDGRESFCAKHSISEQTFSRWLLEHKDFAEAYKIGQAKAKHWWVRLGKQNIFNEGRDEEGNEAPKFNHVLWSMMMRNKFDWTEHRKLNIPGLAKAKNFAEQMSHILGELAIGNLTGSEAQQLCKLVETGVRVYENTEIEKRLTQVEQAQRIGIDDSEFKEETPEQDTPGQV